MLSSRERALEVKKRVRPRPIRRIKALEEAIMMTICLVVSCFFIL